MSIYSTGWSFQWGVSPRGVFNAGCGKWNPLFVEVYVQFVPGHIGHPEGGYYSDPYADFLPPALSSEETDVDDKIRAAVFLLRGDDEKDGQRYVSPLLVLSGDEYNNIGFHDMMDRLASVVDEAVDNLGWRDKHNWVVKEKSDV